jgi:AraC-like DNA-binding protein
MGKIYRVETISQLHEMIGYEKPMHPLISLIEMSQIPVMPVIECRVAPGFYSISLKDGDECRIKYGRQSYDFQERTLMFMAPDHVVEAFSAPDDMAMDSWILAFHPDLLRRSLLGKKMGEYSFFSYDSHEALHLSEEERRIVTGLALAIKEEYGRNKDEHSQELILSNLELLLNYCKRFYGRQFITRSNASKDVVARFEEYLRAWFESGKAESAGLPTVKICGEAMHYSPNYLSDLLKKETGKTTQEHIHFQLIEKAKTLLLGTEEPVNRIAASLGFEYPQHFSKLFKSTTGMSPVEYRR